MDGHAFLSTIHSLSLSPPSLLGKEGGNGLAIKQINGKTGLFLSSSHFPLFGGRGGKGSSRGGTDKTKKEATAPGGKEEEDKEWRRRRRRREEFCAVVRKNGDGTKCSQGVGETTITVHT